MIEPYVITTTLEEYKQRFNKPGVCALCGCSMPIHKWICDEHYKMVKEGLPRVHSWDLNDDSFLLKVINVVNNKIASDAIEGAIK